MEPNRDLAVLSGAVTSPDVLHQGLSKRENKRKYSPARHGWLVARSNSPGTRVSDSIWPSSACRPLELVASPRQPENSRGSGRGQSESGSLCVGTYGHQQPSWSHSGAPQTRMETQEFSGSFELLDGHDTTEVSASLKVLQEPLEHRIPNLQDEPTDSEEREELQVSESAHEQGQRDKCKESSKPYKRYKPYSLSEPHEHYEPYAPHALQGPHEYNESYEVCESYKPHAPREFHEPRESCEIYEPYEPSEPSVLHTPGKPQEPSAPGELHKVHAPAPRKPHKAHKAHEGELLPSSALMLSPSLVIRFPPWVPWSSPKDPVPREFVRKRVFSRKRIRDLSKPKKQWGTPDRKLLWGNQDPIRPVCDGALKTQMSKRLENLALPKEVSYRYIPNRLVLVQYYYSCGRESVIWDMPSPVLLKKPSKRIQKLAQPNRFKIMHLTDRPFSDYIMKEPLQLSGPSARIVRLSIAKSIHPNYVPPKDSENKISFYTLNAVASPRTVDLAHPRMKIEGLCYPREKSEVPIRPISQAALLAKASTRIIALAKAKTLHEDYLPPRDPYWPVSYAAMHSKASPRVQELANPNTRTPVHIVYYDPQVFKVKPAALKSQCSQRIKELAEPLTR
ncbi:testicular haploid expressed gene protein-like [Artibeus jamaicensis]|uniref:testicular haploid expressed gene protein-like n=1 Tax=Artibeus jamaicensis TaxID=9417 RepID=UPI00235A75F9|nr:testicular haploid expressed gene protein-like [Artibeus jamaicensis]